MSTNVTVLNNTTSVDQWWFVDNTGNSPWDPNNKTPPPGGGFANLAPSKSMSHNVKAGVTTNFYFFTFTPTTPVTPYPGYGLSMAQNDAGNGVVLNQIIPGTISPNGGVGSYYLYQKDVNNYSIETTTTVKIVNNTGASLSYFVNTMHNQSSPAKLTDFTFASVTQTPIPSGGSVSVTVFNTVSPNCGIYFFPSTAKSTDTASAVSLVDLSTSAITNVAGSITPTNDGTTITVGLTSSKFPGWAWGLIVLGVILLIIIIVVIFHASSKKGKKKAEGKDDNYDDYDKDNPKLKDEQKVDSEK